MTTEYFIKDLGLREIEAMSPLRVELGIRVVMDGDSLITLQFINSEGDVLKDVTAEIKAGKQSIADAISEQDGPTLTGDATVEELVEAIAAIPSLREEDGNCFINLDTDDDNNLIIDNL